MPGMKRAAAILIISLFLLTAGPGCRLFRQQEPSPDADGDTITFRTADLLTGEPLHFPGDFAEQAVYLIFFADG